MTGHQCASRCIPGRNYWVRTREPEAESVQSESDQLWTLGYSDGASVGTDPRERAFRGIQGWFVNTVDGAEYDGICASKHQRRELIVHGRGGQSGFAGLRQSANLERPVGDPRTEGLFHDKMTWRCWVHAHNLCTDNDRRAAVREGVV